MEVIHDLFLILIILGYGALLWLVGLEALTGKKATLAIACFVAVVSIFGVVYS